ncbi:MAG TPA: tRNA (adenosine(37)-N6)-dimethylallyltransferase MiaA [Opitutaceae bacterium]|nr:tRNA (adenosine(37)-N6)-dimethylallyltransferase MiaA [Opitutaceae bacterium]
MNAGPRPKLHVLTGCTGVGKTEWALRWAEENDAEIVSCDSLLVYRGMDIGTAKPTAAELARVPHHLIDVADVSERYDVTRYTAAALSAVRDILARRRRVLVAGGSGFYLKAYFGAVADEIESVPGLREKIEARLEREGVEALVVELSRLNPAGLGALDTRNPRRVVRALERCLATGRPLVELASEFKMRPGAFHGYDVELTELAREPVVLAKRMEQRIGVMLAAGLVEEVARLDRAGLRANPSAACAIGYRETLDHLDGKLPASELAAAILANTRALARKQRTWFRTQLPAHRVIDAEKFANAAELFGPVS